MCVFRMVMFIVCPGRSPLTKWLFVSMGLCWVSACNVDPAKPNVPYYYNYAYNYDSYYRKPVALSTWGEGIVAAATGDTTMMKELLDGKHDDGRGVGEVAEGPRANTHSTHGDADPRREASDQRRRAHAGGEERAEHA